MDLFLREKENFQFYNVWHHKLFDKCYTKLSLYDKSKITMYGVNENYEKKYNKKKIIKFYLSMICLFMTKPFKLEIIVKHLL